MQLRRTEDPLYGWCPNHGDQFIGTPLPYKRTLTYKDTGRSPKEPPRK